MNRNLNAGKKGFSAPSTTCLVTAAAATFLFSSKTMTPPAYLPQAHAWLRRSVKMKVLYRRLLKIPANGYKRGRKKHQQHDTRTYEIAIPLLSPRQKKKSTSPARSERIRQSGSAWLCRALFCELENALSAGGDDVGHVLLTCGELNENGLGSAWTLSRFPLSTGSRLPAPRTLRITLASVKR